jgi:hypothetical protein
MALLNLAKEKIESLFQISGLFFEDLWQNLSKI